MNQVARAQAMWCLWINDSYANQDKMSQVNSTITKSESTCVQLANFWQIAKWKRLRDALDELTWERMLVLREGDKVRVVDAAEFSAAPLESRFSCHDRAIDLYQALNRVGALSAAAQKILREFFAFAVMTPALSSWISEIIGGSAVKVVSIEFSRYRKGDFIAPHDDCVGARRCNLVSYFDESCEHVDGGALHVRGEMNETIIQPQCNNAILLPMAPANQHWVEPWRSELGRSGVSISFACAS